MILTGHQPTYLPWLGLFNKISSADTFVIFDTVQYLPKEWMSRNKIKANDAEIYLTVPVLKKSFLKKKNLEIKINNSVNWKKKHFKSIQLNYKGAKFYKDYIEFFEKIYSMEWEYLSDLNEYILRYLLKILNIKVEITKLSELNVSGVKSDLVLNVCKKLNAKKFIFGEQGKNYVKKDDFIKNDIKTIFQKYNHPAYEQLQGKFIPYLSVIDLLFNCGNESLKIINYNQNL